MKALYSRNWHGSMLLACLCLLLLTPSAANEDRVRFTSQQDLICGYTSSSRLASQRPIIAVKDSSGVPFSSLTDFYSSSSGLRVGSQSSDLAVALMHVDNSLGNALYLVLTAPATSSSLSQNVYFRGTVTSSSSSGTTSLRQAASWVLSDQDFSVYDSSSGVFESILSASSSSSGGAVLGPFAADTLRKDKSCVTVSIPPSSVSSINNVCARLGNPSSCRSFSPNPDGFDDLDVIASSSIRRVSATSVESVVADDQYSVSFCFDDCESVYDIEYVISVKEDTPLGTLLADDVFGGIKAVDVLTGAVVDVELLTDTNFMFGFNATSGQLTLLKPLDFETRRSHVLTFGATLVTNNGTQYDATTKLTLSVENVNERAPIFSKKIYTATIEEGANIGANADVTFVGGALGVTDVLEDMAESISLRYGTC